MSSFEKQDRGNDRTTLPAVYDGADNLLMRFEYADGRMPVAMTRNGERYYLACDPVGTLRVVTDSTGSCGNFTGRPWRKRI